MVELALVVGSVINAGDSIPELEGIRERNGTRNSYPVASMSASTEERELPSVNTTSDAVKCDIGGFGVTCAPSGGVLPSFSD